MVRPSPSESATLFEVGEIKKGNDGGRWIVTINCNGVKRWRRDNYLHLESNQIKSFTKSGTIEFSSKILGGEEGNVPLPLPVKTEYDVFFINKDSIAIISNVYLEKNNISMNKSFFVKMGWELFSQETYSDSGMFGFFDSKKLRQINNFLGEKPTSFPMNSDTLTNTKKVFFLKGNAVDIELPESIYGVVCGNGAGDGMNKVYISGEKKEVVGAFFPGFSFFKE